MYRVKKQGHNIHKTRGLTFKSNGIIKFHSNAGFVIKTESQ